jgi:hypothetical protein
MASKHVVFVFMKTFVMTGVMVDVCDLLYLGGEDRRIENLRLARAKIRKPYLRNTIQTKDLRV